MKIIHKLDCQPVCDNKTLKDIHKHATASLASPPAMSSTTEPKKLHIALFPWLAFGHIIPFLEVAKHIARRGHKVSFISTLRNIQRLPKIPEELNPMINLVQIPLPHVKNLPENAEATTDIPSHMIPYLKRALESR